jgi:cytochrome c biogenesis factor
MEFAFLFLILPTVIALVAAYFISLFASNKLKKTENKNAKLFSVLTFIGSFLIIVIAIFVLIISNIQIGR